MKELAVAFVVAFANAFAPPVHAQETAATPSVEQIRTAFRDSVELCALSVQSGKHFEEMPEASGKIAKSRVLRPAAAPGQTTEPAFHDYWHVPGVNHVSAFQTADSCTITWVARLWGAAETMDLSGEREAAIGHATALLPGSTEHPFYEADGAVGARFIATDGGRSIPFFVALWKSGDLSVAMNVVPHPSSVLPNPLIGFENLCLRELYAGRNLEANSFELQRADTSLQAASGFIFYGNSRFGRLGLDPADPKACAYHEPASKLPDVQRLIPAEQWGLKLSVVAAPKGGVIAIARAP
jgi:hypothetical protein